MTTGEEVGGWQEGKQGAGPSGEPDRPEAKSQRESGAGEPAVEGKGWQGSGKVGRWVGSGQPGGKLVGGSNGWNEQQGLGAAAAGAAGTIEDWDSWPVAGRSRKAR